MFDELVGQIREHVVSRHGRAIPFPVASPEAIEAAEAALGFRLPELLKAVYLGVGNGGFGPGRGGDLIGLAGGFQASAGDLAAVYADFLLDEWREGLLPFCDWGCAIFTCVDTNDRKGRIFLCDNGVVVRQRYDLEGFVKRWLKGVDGII